MLLPPAGTRGIFTPVSPDVPHIALSPARQEALGVLERLRAAGHEAYFAGGCVRDQLLGLIPKDYDIATDAPPSRVRALFPHSQAVGAAFGVILVQRRHSSIEVATFREDAAYVDGRRPTSVRFATASEDARRRDFTINGLFLDPIDNRVIDYVGGQADLAARRLRAIGNPEERFAEDYLRLLRAVRFAARFDLAVDPRTELAIRTHAGALIRISPERIADELRRMLTDMHRVAAWRMLWSYGLVGPILRFLFPEPRTNGAPVGPAPVLFEKIAPGTSIDFSLALAGVCVADAMARDPAADARLFLGPRSARRCVRALRQALRLSNDESDRLEQILETPALLLEDAPPRIATLKRFLATPTSSDTRHLLEALAHSGHFASRIHGLQARFAELEKTDCHPPPLLTGDDLTDAGWRPGPIFKRVLDQVYDAQLEDRLSSREQALALARELAQTEPSTPK